MIAVIISERKMKREISSDVMIGDYAISAAKFYNPRLYIFTVRHFTRRPFYSTFIPLRFTYQRP
jgi:hypothetical protein